MDRIAQVSKKSKDLLKEIKTEVNELSRLNTTNHDDLEKLHKKVSKIHAELNDYETQLDEDLSIPDIQKNKPSKYEKKELEIPQSIIIKNKKKSSSFRSWLLNNNEL